MQTIMTHEFEYNKKVFNKYYRGKFKYRNKTLYIIFQVITTLFLIVPGILFAIIYWGITNPITKYLLWKEEIKYNKGNNTKYQFFFNQDNITIKRNDEELSVVYNTFKKIRNDKNGVYLLSRNKDFFIPITEIENLEDLANILKNIKIAKIKLYNKKTKES